MYLRKSVGKPVLGLYVVVPSSVGASLAKLQRLLKS